jgi:hypothetical protein
VRVVGALPQLGDPQLHAARAGVPPPVAVPVAVRGPPVGVAFAVCSADLGGHVRVHQRLRQHADPFAEEVDVRLVVVDLADELE